MCAYYVCIYVTVQCLCGVHIMLLLLLGPHRKSVMEREELMEDLYEKKIEILERNVLETQVYTRKKRKLEKERDEVNSLN